MSNRDWGEENGPREPALTTPALLGTMRRRTSTVDVLRPEGLESGSVVRGRGRDLVLSSGRPREVDSAWVEVEVDTTRHVTGVRCSSPAIEKAPLVGHALGREFRSEAKRATSDRSVARALVEDVVIVGMLTRYVEIYFDRRPPVGFARPNICAGWIDSGALVSMLDRTGDVALPQGPIAPDLNAEGNEGWHVVPDLPPLGLRRARRVDITPEDGALSVDAMFRDSFVGRDARQRIIHEYSLSATADTTSGVVTAIRAVPRVLPYNECPFAATSVDRLVGQPADRLRDEVREYFRGVTTCTHLNSLIRAIADPVEQAITHGAGPELRQMPADEADEHVRPVPNR